jgi:hypothetical protein
VRQLFTILFISSCAVFAQEDIFSGDGYSGAQKDAPQDTSEFTYNAFQEKIYFWQMEKNWKLSPFDLLNSVPSLGIDLETTMKPGLSFQYGAAFIPSFLQFAVGSQEDQFNWMNGYRLRFESRWYGFRRPNLYMSGEMAFRHLVINERTPFGMEGDGSGNFAYFINEDMLYHRFSTHFNYKIGVQKVFDNQFVMDLFMGFSLRRNNVLSGSQGPEGGEAQGDWNRMSWTLENGHKFGFAMPIIGLRLGWHKDAKPNL